MAEFRLSPDDFGYLIQRRRLSMLRAFAPYLLAALLAAAALSVVSVPAAMLPLGMALAWSTNAYVEWFAIRRDLLRHFDFAAEPVTIELDEGGVHVTNAHGSGFMRWDAISLARFPDGFMVLDEGVEVLILPRRHLSTTELLFLQQRELAGDGEPGVRAGTS